jgi:hypothetical protein
MRSDARYYRGELTWQGRVLHVLWRNSGEKDEYVFDAQRKRLRAWNTREELEAEAFQLESETHAVSLDAVKDFVDGKSGLDSESSLNFWNFFNDLEAGSDSQEFARIDKASNELYGKLFSMTSAGSLVGLPPAPLTIAEMGELREVMRAGLTVFERAIVSAVGSQQHLNER